MLVRLGGGARETPADVHAYSKYLRIPLWEPEVNKLLNILIIIFFQQNKFSLKIILMNGLDFCPMTHLTHKYGYTSRGKSHVN